MVHILYNNNNSFSNSPWSFSIMGSELNKTNTFNIESMIDKTLLKIEVLTMFTVFTLALFGNLIVIITLLIGKNLRKKHLKKDNKTAGSKFTRMNFFILHLSLADIYVSLGNILTMLLWRMNNNIFFGGDLACRLVVYFQLVSVYYSTYVLITMTIDRYEAICRPMLGLSWTRRRGLAYIWCAFVLSHLQGIPQVVFFAQRTIPNSSPPIQTCYAIFHPLWLQNAYIVYTWLMQFFIPLVVIVACYASISVKVLRSIRNKSGDAKPLQRETNSVSRLSVGRKYSNMNLRKFSINRELFTGLIKSNAEMSNIQCDYSSEVTGPYSHHHQQNHHQNNELLRSHCSKNFSSSKIKTIKLTLTVIILYVICSTPYFIGMIMNVVVSSNYSNNLISK